jgi:hypothetical protein
LTTTFGLLLNIFKPCSTVLTENCSYDPGCLPISFCPKKKQMKNFRTPLLCLCTVFFSLCSSAQNEKDPTINDPDYNKPKLFSNLPDRIPVSIEEINALLDSPVGFVASLRVADNSILQFNGQVVSKAAKYDNKVQSVVIRSTNFEGANLTISKILKEDGTITFTGRIISFKHGDLYVLQNIDGQFTLVKKNFYDLINE